MGDGVGRGRDAFNKQAWRRAYDELSAASVVEPLEVDDLERLASAAYLAGLSEERLDAAYEAVRTRMLIAACRAVGDDDTAELEVAGAVAVFDRLASARSATPPLPGLRSARPHPRPAV